MSANSKRTTASGNDDASTSRDDPVEGVVRLLRIVLAEALRDAVGDIKEELRSTIASELRAKTERTTADARLLTVEDVAAHLNVRPATVRDWIRTGYLPAVHVGPAGRRYAVRRADLENLLEKRAAEKKPMDSQALAIQIVKSARTRARGRKE